MGFVNVQKIFRSGNLVWIALLILLLCVPIFAEDFYLDYTQYTFCNYKKSLDTYCDANDRENAIWKSGKIRINLTDDSLLFVFLGKETYRIKLNTIRKEYNTDNEEIGIMTGRSGTHNYMFVIGADYFNFLQIRGWGYYFLNTEGHTLEANFFLDFRSNCRMLQSILSRMTPQLSFATIAQPFWKKAVQRRK